MSNTIDRRVVEMRFDNQQFESRAGQTVGTLEKLKNALNFGHASDGLDNLNRSVKSFNMNPLQSAVDGVRVSFSKLEAIAMTTLVNITNRAVDAGVALAKNLTIDQLSNGWQKYADKTSAVQTIMAATSNQFTDTAEQMAYVNSQLEKLNWFTDETSYNFVDMVGNIGKFTSNNIPLDQAVTAMQGIATWAAVSGQNADVASRAMYQLSQAMGVGVIKLQDWRSIETANMSTAEFRETALETAVSLGTLQKEADGVYRTIDKGTEVTVAKFNTALNEGWFTSEVLMQTLQQYGDFTNQLYEVSEATGESATDLLQWMDRYREAGENATEILQDMAEKTGLSVEELQGYMEELTDETNALGEKALRAAQEAKTFEEAVNSVRDAVSTGWAKTFEIIFGDYEKARVRWTALANELWDIFASGAEARNELLEEALGLPASLVNDQVSGWEQIEKAIEAAGIPLEDFIKKCLELGGKGGEGIDSIEAFKNSLSEGWLTGTIVAQAIDAFIGPIETVEGVIDGAVGSFERFKEIINEVISGNFGWGNGEERMRKFTEAGWDATAMQEAVNKVLDGGELTLADYEAALVSASDEELKAAGYTDEQIDALRELQAQYAEYAGVIDDTTGSVAGLKTGSELLFDGISTGWNAIKGIFVAMKKGWDIAFPPMTADRLYDILKAFNEATHRFDDWLGNWDDSEGDALSQTVINIRDTFTGLGSVLGIGLDALKEVGSFLKDTFGDSVASAIDTILDYTAKVGRVITNLRSWLTENNIIRKGLDLLKDKIVDVKTSLTGWFTELKKLPIVQGWITSIKSWFTSLGDTIVKTFPNATKRLSEFWTMLKASFKIGGGISEVIKKLEQFGYSLQTDILAIWEKMKQSDLFGGLVTGLESIWKAIKTLDFSALPDWFKSLWESVKKFFQPVLDFFKPIKDKLVGYAKDIRAGAIAIDAVLSDFVTYLKDHLANIIVAIGMFLVAKKIKNFISMIIGIARAITAPVTTIVDAFDGFASAARGLGIAMAGFAIAATVGSIIALALAAAELGKIPTAQMWKGVAVIAVLALVVAGVIAVLGTLFEVRSLIEPRTVKEQAISLLRVVGLATAIMLVVLAFGKAADTVSKYKDSPGILVAAFFGILAVVGVIGLVMGLVSKFGGAGGKGIAAPIVALAGSVYILVQAFADIVGTITETNDLEKIDKAMYILDGLIGFVGIFEIILALISRIPGGGKGSGFGTGLGILAVVVAVKILAGVINDILNMKLPEEGMTEDKINMLIGIVAAIGSIMAALSAMPARAGLNGIGVLGVALAIDLLVVAIKSLGSMDSSDVHTAVGAIGELLIFFAIFTKLTQAGSKLKASSALVFMGLSASILILTGAVVLLGLLDPAQVAIGTIAISALMIAFGLMAALSSAASDVKLGPLIGLAVIVAVLTAAVVALSFLDPGAVLVATVALSALMVACGLMAVLMVMVEDIKIGPFLGVVAIIAVIAAAIYALAVLDPGNVLVAVLALTIAMTMFTVLSAVLAYVSNKMSGEIASSIPVFAAMILVLAGIAAVIIYLTNNIQNPALALQSALMLTSVMLAMSKMMGVVAQLGELGFKKSIVGGAAFVVILAALAGISAILGAVNEKYPQVQEAIQKGLPMMRTLGSVLGEVFAGLLSGLFSIDIDFSDIIGKLQSFAEGISGFTESIGEMKIDEGTANAVGSLAKVMLTLAGADFINSITSLFGSTTGMDDFASGLPKLGLALRLFSINLGQNINVDAIQGAATAAESLAKMAKSLPTKGGWKSKILGDSEGLETFGTNICTFADKLIEFNDKITADGVNIDTEKMGQVTDAAQKLVDLQNALPSSGGFLQKIIGDTETLDQFSTGIIAFGDAMVAITDSETGLGRFTSEDAFKCIEYAANGAAKLVELQESLGEDAGIFGKLFGGGSIGLDDFSQEITTFSKNLAAIISGTDGLGQFKSEDDFKPLEYAATAVERIKALVFDSTGEAIFDTTYLTDLGTDIATFGGNLQTFSQDIEDVDTAKVTSLSRSIGNFVAAFSEVNGKEISLPEGFADSLGGFVSSITTALSDNVDTFETAGTESVQAYLNAIGADTTSAQTAGETLASTVSNELSTAVTNFTTAGTDGAKAYLAGIGDSETDATTAGTNLSSWVIGKLNDAATITKFKTAGETSGSNYASGVSSFEASARTAGQTLSAAAVAGLNAGDAPYNYGTYVGAGFVRGINAYVRLARAAGRSLGAAAVQGIAEGTDSHSPSRAAAKVGDYTGIGYTAALLKYTFKAAEAGEEVGTAAIDGIRSAMVQIATVFTDADFTQPVITPVVDLTNAQTSAQMISSMFNRSIDISADTAAITGASVTASRLALSDPWNGGKARSDEEEPEAKYTFNNNFSVGTTNDPDEFARRVSYILQRQVERKSATWGS